MSLLGWFNAISIISYQSLFNNFGGLQFDTDRSCLFTNNFKR